MDNLYLKATEYTPEIKFENSGNLMIEGRSMPGNVSGFYDPLIDWVKFLNVATVTMMIKLEHINTASSKKLFELLKILDANSKIRQLIIHWYYEEDDDILEKGQVYEDFLVRALFKYYALTESL